MKKKLLIVVNYFRPYISGVSEYSREVAERLCLKYDVTVLTSRHDRSLPLIEQSGRYRIVRANILFSLDKGYISPDFLIKFHKLASESDVVNMHMPMIESGILASLTTKPILATYQCDMAFVGSPIRRLAVAVVRHSMTFALKKAKVVTVLSKDYAASSALARAHLGKTVEVIPPNRFSLVELGATREPGSDSLICGFAGRFVLEKGIDSIVSAAELLSNHKIEFWLAGDFQNVAGGSIFARVKERLEALGSKVKVLGRLSDEELIEFYRQIDVLLLPSTNRFEAFGMVQMEAMFFGATVVTSDLPGVRETVARTGIGQVCEPGSGQSLATAILRARSERAMFTREHVRSTVQATFKPEQFARSYEDIIDGLTP